MKLLKAVLIALLASLLGAVLTKNQSRYHSQNSLRDKPADKKKSVSESTADPEYPIDPLSPKEFKRRAGDLFPSSYLTVIGIIQAVALGILANNVFGQMSDMSLNSSSLLFAARAFISFAMLVLVLFQYNYFVGIHKWFPDFLDTLIPLLLGIAEIAPLYFLDDPQGWWLSNAVLTFFGTLAYYNTRRRCKRPMYAFTSTGTEVYNHVLKVNAGNIFTGAFACGFFLSMSFWYDWEVYSFQIGTLALFIFGAMLLFTFWRAMRFLGKLHDLYGFKF